MKQVFDLTLKNGHLIVLVEAMVEMDVYDVMRLGFVDDAAKAAAEVEWTKPLPHSMYLYNING